jgi:hypothetical protein
METVEQRISGPRYANRKVQWQDIHKQLVRLAKQRAGQDFEEGQWLLRGMKAGIHIALAYGSYFEYVERVFGYTPRIAADRIRVAQALEQLPAMAEALRTAAISWSIARELTRVAVAQTEREWLDAVKTKTVRQVERMVSGRSKGDRPGDPPDETARRHVVRFEVGGDVLALLREAQAELVRRSGGHLGDDDVIRLLAASVLGGARDEGRSAYQVAMTICGRCGNGKQEACGDAIPVTPTVVERACCDAQHIGEADPASGARPRASQTIPPVIRREVLRRHGGCCAVPGCSNSTFVEVHHLDRREEGGTHDPRRLIPLCSAHHAAEHEGRLIIEGDAITGFSFYHGDRAPYGAQAVPETTMAWADAFSALKNLGFKEGPIRQALEAVRRDVDHDADAQSITRAALARLRRHRHEHAQPSRPRSKPAPTPARPAPPAKPTMPKNPRGSRLVEPDPRGSKPASAPADETPFRLATGALVKLGFTREQARDAVSRARTHVGPDPNLESLIRAALRQVPLHSRAREPAPIYRLEPPSPPTWASRHRLIGATPPTPAPRATLRACASWSLGGPDSSGATSPTHSSRRATKYS